MENPSLRKYTNKEIIGNINKLQKQQDILKRERTQLTKQINSLSKQIKFFESIDKSQLKII